jgi:membrane protein required for beta-lactamase induction
VISAYFDFLDRHRDKRWLLYSDTSMTAADGMRELNAAALARILDREDARTLLLANALVGAGEQVGRWWLARPEIPKADAIDQFERVVRAMIDASL